MYVDNFAKIISEIQRWRRYKIHIVKAALLTALKDILKQLLCSADFSDYSDHEEAADKLARDWFESKKSRAGVAKLLRKFQMDEEAIEAEAFRLRIEDLDRLDRMLTSLEFRRDKLLRSITEYRHTVSKQLQQCADRILENDAYPRLIVSTKPDL